MMFMFPIKTEGTENVPRSGAFILAVNHKSNLDPCVAAITCPRQLTFMAKAELFKNKLFGGLIRRLGAFPIKRGTGDMAAIKTAVKILSEERAMLIFPEGGRVRKGKPSQAKTGVVNIARHCDVPVIPLHIKNGYRFMRRVTAVYGEPITFDEYKDQRLSAEQTKALSDKVLETIYEL